MNEIIVWKKDLPYFIRGQVLRDSDGDYNIYINARMSADMQRKTIWHELNHVKRGDFDSAYDIKYVESL